MQGPERVSLGAARLITADNTQPGGAAARRAPVSRGACSGAAPLPLLRAWASAQQASRALLHRLTVLLRLLWTRRGPPAPQCRATPMPAARIRALLPQGTLQARVLRFGDSNGIAQPCLHADFGEAVVAPCCGANLERSTVLHRHTRPPCPPLAISRNFPATAYLLVRSGTQWT